MLTKLLLLLYLIISVAVLVLVSIVLPRIAVQDKNKPIFIYVGYYILNTIIFNYFFNIYPLKTIFLNLIFLLLSNFIGAKLRVMGLTGQICSGKSSVARYLNEKYKAVVIEIDKLNRDVLEMEEVKKEIRRGFGDDVFDENNNLNKLEMRRIIYSDEKKKRLLEKITHGRVFKLLIKTIMKEKLLYRTKYVFIENAILLRFAFFRYICFPIVAVCTTKKAEIIGRVMERDSCDSKTAEKILESQMSVKDFADKSDYVIFNDSTLEDLKKEVDIFMSKFSN